MLFKRHLRKERATYLTHRRSLVNRWRITAKEVARGYGLLSGSCSKGKQCAWGPPSRQRVKIHLVGISGSSNT